MRTKRKLKKALVGRHSHTGMSLPFLNSRKIASVIIATRKPDGSVMPKHEEGEQEPGLMSAAEDLISAISMKDAKAVAEALKAAFDMMNPSEGEE